MSSPLRERIEYKCYDYLSSEVADDIDELNILMDSALEAVDNILEFVEEGTCFWALHDTLGGQGKLEPDEEAIYLIAKGLFRLQKCEQYA